MSSKNAPNKSPTAPHPENPHANRETVESIIVAIILAFLFRGFIAEAFVIPTGSMAPSLQGNHKDLACEKCGYRYQSSASVENDDSQATVDAITCPICHFTTEINPENLDHSTYSGDRIVVSKFSYLLAEPKRWDVIVFKFPGNAKQNYIKRLIGLPNETIRIQYGDLRVKGKGDDQFRIARKPDYRQKAMLQVVDDNHFIAQQLIDAGFPIRWRQGRADSHWTVLDGGRRFEIDGSNSDTDWLRYRHIVPTALDWEDVANGRRIAARAEHEGELISDYYAYNTSLTGSFRGEDYTELTRGQHWVGDLAVEVTLQVQSSQGELLLDLVEAGRHFTASINVKDGVAKLVAKGLSFSDDTGREVASPAGQTALKGPGSYHLRFSNVDDELRLWVNESLVQFDGPTTYDPGPDVTPKWSQDDPGDLEPVGVGSRGVKAHIDQLRVLRDIYYIAGQPANDNCDYDDKLSARRDNLAKIWITPSIWGSTKLFAERRAIEFQLAADQFFPCGDNSPHSSDARLWGRKIDSPENHEEYDRGIRNDLVGLDVPHFVRRDQLTGEALMIYYPHPWYSPVRIYFPSSLNPTKPWTPIAVTPNFGRMGLIR